MKINLGSGRDYRPGWLNVDVSPDCHPDRVFDLTHAPWPIDDDCADEVLLRHTLECIDGGAKGWATVFQELYRICKPGAVVDFHLVHPRHKDFASDPSYVRAVLPELFACLDLEKVEHLIINGIAGNTLARQVQVDFALANVQYQLAPKWLADYSEKRIDDTAILHAMETYYNVVQSIQVRLSVRKPFRPGHALRRVDAICIERRAGMGDVLMALAAAKSLKALSGKPLVMATSPANRALVEACPHVDRVIDDVAEIAGQYANLHYLNLKAASFGLARKHQVDAYLDAYGVAMPAEMKQVELDLSVEAANEANTLVDTWPAMQPDARRVLLHIGQGDANRTWPLAQWATLARSLVVAGEQVVLIGADASLAAHPAFDGIDGLCSALGALSALGTVALMRASDVMVSADSGPVQLAAAADIGIVALFSVVDGANRLPYRHGEAAWRAREVKPSCGFYPCYRYLEHADYMAPYDAALQNGTLPVVKLFANWCPDNGSFACMKEQIDVPTVLAAIDDVMRDPRG